MVVVAEQDILGDRLIRRSKRKKRASDFIAEASSLSARRHRRPCRSRH
jgi:transcription-repair coupling factor (superfamily II helicase)